MIKWTEKEIQILRENFANKTNKEISVLLHGRFKPNNVNSKGVRLGLKKVIDPYKRYNLSRLLSDELQTYYWIGYIFADGYFSSNHTTLSLSSIDIDRIKSLHNYVASTTKIYTKSNFTNYKLKLNRRTMYTITLSDTKNIPIIENKFDIKHLKTYYPPHGKILTDMSDDQFLALLIGFIDGDGSICNSKGVSHAKINIAVHFSWFEFLNSIIDRLNLIYQVKISNAKMYKKFKNGVQCDNSSVIQIATHKVVYGLKQFILDKNLDTLKRKWDKVDINRKMLRKPKRDKHIMAI